MLNRDEIIKILINNIMGSLAQSTECNDIANKAYDMGLSYSQSRKFNNSKYYHNYKFTLDDGEEISSSSYFNQFMCRTGTHAYINAETAVKSIEEFDNDNLFHLVRDKRIGINGVFKAIMSPNEPQQLNTNDYTLIIAAFCCGVLAK